MASGIGAVCLVLLRYTQKREEIIYMSAKTDLYSTQSEAVFYAMIYL